MNKARSFSNHKKVILYFYPSGSYVYKHRNMTLYQTLKSGRSNLLDGRRAQGRISQKVEFQKVNIGKGRIPDSQSLGLGLPVKIALSTLLTSTFRDIRPFQHRPSVSRPIGEFDLTAVDLTPVSY